MRLSRIFLAAVLTISAACSGEQGDAGANGANGKDGVNAPTTGTISGTVTDATATTPLAGVAVAVTTTGGNALATATTDANGAYSVTAPIGTVQVTFTKQYFTSPGALLVGVVGGVTTTANAAMAEASTGKPSISVSTPTSDVGYGSTVTATASASDPNGDALTYTWSNGTAARYDGSGTKFMLGSVSGSGTTATVTLPSMADAFKPSFDTANAPAQNIAGYTIPDRFGILSILPDTRGEMTVIVTVTDGRGQTNSSKVAVDAAPVLTGARNVAINTPVYLNAGHDGTFTWTLAASDATSTAALNNTSSRTPFFVADKAGYYTVTEGANTIKIYAGNWLGVITGGSGDSIAVDGNCTQCHTAGGLAPDNFTPWMQTPHATMLTRNIDGADGAGYTETCIVCHTVGNDRGVAGNGFDDVQAAKGWKFPSSNVSTNWTNMVTGYPDVARLANIQCENCHGPQAGGTLNTYSAAHTATKATADGLWKSARISYSSELCATCHASGTGHHNYSEWNTSDPKTGYSHSNREAAASVGARTGTLNNHCGRCHAAQGFVAYAAQIKAGNSGNIAAGNTVLTDVTTANVEPVTCTACHDPHDASNPSQLRSVSNTFGDTAVLAAGFGMDGVGKGALCMTCHNSRNGLHDATHAPTGYSAPHQACQGDVFAGRNAYFVGAMTSKHAAIEDTCVGCHMARNPVTHVAHGAAAVSGHVFRITDENRGTLCAGCHGTGVDGEGLAASVEDGIASLGKTISAAVQAKINAAGTVTVVGYNADKDEYSAATQIAATAITVTGIEEIHGQIGFNLQLTGTTLAFPSGAQLATFGVQLGSLMDTQTTPAALFAASGNLTKAGWNYFLVEGDQSKGFHNPSFVNAVLSATAAADLTN